MPSVLLTPALAVTLALCIEVMRPPVLSIVRALIWLVPLVFRLPPRLSMTSAATTVTSALPD